MLFRSGRDGVLPRLLGTVAPSRGTPVPATVVVVLAMYLVIAVAWFGMGGDPPTLFVASGTIGTLILLVAYALATVGAAKLLFFSGYREVRVGEVVIPVLALGLIGYTLFRNVSPYPEGAAGLYPAVSVAWIAVGVLIVLLRPGVARQAGAELTGSEGLSDESRPRDRSTP